MPGVCLVCMLLYVGHVYVPVGVPFVLVCVCTSPYLHKCVSLTSGNTSIQREQNHMGPKGGEEVDGLE